MAADARASETVPAESLSFCATTLQRVVPSQRPATVGSLRTWLRHRGVHKVRRQLDIPRLATELLGHSSQWSADVKESVSALAARLKEIGGDAKSPAHACMEEEFYRRRAVSLSNELRKGAVFLSMSLSARLRWLCDVSYIIVEVSVDALIAALQSEGLLTLTAESRVQYDDSCFAKLSQKPADDAESKQASESATSYAAAISTKKTTLLLGRGAVAKKQMEALGPLPVAGRAWTKHALSKSSDAKEAKVWDAICKLEVPWLGSSDSSGKGKGKGKGKGAAGAPADGRRFLEMTLQVLGSPEALQLFEAAVRSEAQPVLAAACESAEMEGVRLPGEESQKFSMWRSPIEEKLACNLELMAGGIIKVSTAGAIAMQQVQAVVRYFASKEPAMTIQATGPLPSDGGLRWLEFRHEVILATSGTTVNVWPRTRLLTRVDCSAEIDIVKAIEEVLSNQMKGFEKALDSAANTFHREDSHDGSDRVRVDADLEGPGLHLYRSVSSAWRETRHVERANREAREAEERKKAARAQRFGAANASHDKERKIVAKKDKEERQKKDQFRQAEAVRDKARANQRGYKQQMADAPTDD